MKRRHQVKNVDLPQFGPPPESPAAPSAARLLRRIASARAMMRQRKFTHLVIYADREHTANLTWLTNFDARFEEALLVLGHENDALLVTGNECAGYLGISALHAAGKLRHELFQDFSLLDQPRNASRTLREILGDERIDNKARVGAAGWKYFDSSELLDIPSFIADVLRQLTGGHVINAADMFMHAGHGLRSTIDVDDIPVFEFANWHASEGLKRIIRGLREDMTDFEAMSHAGMNGLPLGCHATFATGSNSHLGLTGPTGQRIRKGSPLSANLGYWRANICRSAWVAETRKDLPVDAQDYVDAFAGPYVSALGEWFGLLRVGTEGGHMQALIDKLLPSGKFGITLNPGHLIDIDEWVSSPVFPGSKLPLRSGMAIQSDIIPSSSVYGSSRMEDGYVIADAELRGVLREKFPSVHARCMARRQFMENVIGIELSDNVLPLSNLAGVVQPWLLSPEKVIALN